MELNKMVMGNKNVWKGIKKEELSTQAFSIALKIAEKLRDPIQVEKVVLHEDNISTIGEIPQYPWGSTSLSHGYPGTILFFAELDRHFPEEGWDIVAHEHLLALQEKIKAIGVSSESMFGGLAGISFATLSASHNRKRYQRFLGQLDQLLAKRTVAMIEDEYTLHKKRGGSNPHIYDVINGVSGIGRYLLASKQINELYSTLQDVLRYLVYLSQPIEWEGGRKIPGWYLTQEMQYLDKDKEMYSKGNFNLGFAHGIPGPLALLSLSMREGIEVTGQRDAIHRIAEWLMQWKETDEYGIMWRDRVSLEDELESGFRSQSSFRRDAWCYGTPGVAHSLYLAGEALQDSSYCNLAFQAYDHIFKRPVSDWNLYSDTFCHGKAGLLQMTMRMDMVAGDGRYQPYIEYLTETLVNNYNPSVPFGYQDIEPRDGERVGLNKAGALEGAAGIGLALLSASSKQEPIWDQPFLLA
ncbi:lanthionine synthetase C family protein [Brevibacillus halotolerans]|uniref:lanthionine synthetase C family protein n=1 Tax=Brevibacillus TaxID=55080 RepID=UPI00215BD8DB|nr:MULTISPECIES: lanthionine synthetase C family protein [Brevibacillus]MCR8966192.1 lanthionine synthetase C family protein [Brevibacillus laterosporus]MCZ0838349.1 lanthionine synthetase C family protein [Brevibacillus halotolerans]